MSIYSVKPENPQRFEFTEISQPDESATISELLNDLYWDENYTGKENPTLKLLERTLLFVDAVAGIKCGSITDRLPLVALKTMKLLFMINHKRKTSTSKKRNLFKIIDPPHLKDTATMEFATTSSISPDKEGEALISSLLAKLSIEIDEDRLLRINHILKDATSIMNYIETGTYDSVDFLSERIGNNNADLTKAYEFLTKKADEYQPMRGDEATIPLHEVVYTYLRCLGFLHFAMHHQEHSRSIRIPEPIPSITDDLASFCKTLNTESNFLIEPYTAFVSVNDAPKLVAIFPKPFASIVALATGIKGYRKQQLIEDAVRAKKILIEYIWRNFESRDPNARLLSLHNIIAALCSLRHQRKIGTSYEPNWPGRDKQLGDSPQRFLDKRLDKKNSTIPQGVISIYYERYTQYLFSFMGKAESNNAWMDFQSARLNAYTRILKSYNIDNITKCIGEFDQYCLEQTAMAFANVIRMYNNATS